METQSQGSRAAGGEWTWRCRAGMALLLLLAGTACGTSGSSCRTDDPDAEPARCSEDTREETDTMASTASFLRGVNVAGAEFAPEALPGRAGVDYVWPSPESGYDVSYFLDKGMNTLRLPFLWERLQPALGQPFDAAELDRLVRTVDAFERVGATVILDLHNYGRYDGQVLNASAVTSADLADLWARLATRYAHDPQVVFGLMNEPHDMDTAAWLDAANAALAAIRAAGADNLVLVSGNHWSGAHSWSAPWIPESQRNATVMRGVVDPRDRFAFEVHQYLDADASGTSADCTSASAGAEALAPLTAWLTEHGFKAFLGEFGAGASATCLTALRGLVAHVEAHPEAYLGWTYWAAGPWWGDYFTSLEPTAAGDAPQMGALAPYLGSSAAPR